VELTIAHLGTAAAHIQLDTVKTSRELYRALAQDPKPCDVILLDYYFAGLTGVEILKELETLTTKYRWSL
jgi:response regulator of citrate/malate metabolism